MTSVGRCSRSISQAVVADLPVPVAPSSTTSFSPARIRRSSSSIAAGWSPDGSKSETTSNLPVLGTMSLWTLTGADPSRSEVVFPSTVRAGCDIGDAVHFRHPGGLTAHAPGYAGAGHPPGEHGQRSRDPWGA